MTRLLPLLFTLAFAPVLCAPIIIQSPAAGGCCTSPPTVRGIGNVAGGTSAVSPGLPTGTAVGDLLVMFIETANEAITVSGFTEAPSSPQGTGTGGGAAATRMTIFYRIATGTDPTTTSDSGQHQIARIIGITTGTFNASTPFDANAGTTQAATASVSIPGATTTVDNTLVIAVTSGALPDSNGVNRFASWVNTSLSSIVEQIDQSRTSGNGGALGVITGTMDTSGTYNSTTSTATVSTERGVISLAVTPI